MDTALAEKVFFDSHGIKVTNARFIVSKQTYAMASVNSVKVGVTDRTPTKNGATIVGSIGLLIAVVMVMNPGGNLLMAFVALGLIAWGILWFRSIKPMFEYKLILTTSSGETTALTSFSEPDIRVVETALNNAIVYRG